jgi:hypothetical protein
MLVLALVVLLLAAVMARFLIKSRNPTVQMYCGFGFVLFGMLGAILLAYAVGEYSYP